MATVKQLTIRHPSAELVQSLQAVAADRGESLNATVLRLLSEALGLDERRQRLQRYATWTAEDLQEFDTILSEQRVVDEGLWR